MSNNKLLELVSNNEKLHSFITNISSGNIGIPYLLDETLKMLDDDSPMYCAISDDNKLALCRMMQTYFNDCWAIYIENEDFNKLLDFGKIETYKIEAYEGLRYATVNEIENGVKGLIGEDVYPAGEECYKKLCLLNWTFNGRSYYFRQAGYKLDYTEDGKVATPLYTMIQMCAKDLVEIFNWVQTDDYTKAIKKIEKMKKNKGYKYSNYERDEVVEDITIKQLIYNITHVFPKNSDNRDYRKALALSIKAKNGTKLKPLEISELRTIYEKHALDVNSRNQENVEANDKLRKECEELLANRKSGKINPDHFAFTIIETLKKGNYKRCSAKQYSFIKEALGIINNTPENETNEVDTTAKTETEIISDDEINNSLMSMSDLIGSGALSDFD